MKKYKITKLNQQFVRATYRDYNGTIEIEISSYGDVYVTANGHDAMNMKHIDIIKELNEILQDEIYSNNDEGFYTPSELAQQVRKEQEK